MPASRVIAFEAALSFEAGSVSLEELCALGEAAREEE
jgi:hypothetical protein